jgi:hypothetical protein
MREMKEELTPTEIVIKYLRAQYIKWFIISDFFIMALFFSVNVIFIYLGGLIPTISTIIGILSCMLLVKIGEGRRVVQCPVDYPSLFFRKLCESYGEGYSKEAYVKLRRKLSQKIKFTTPFYYLILIAFAILVDVLSPNKLNLEISNDPVNLLCLIFFPCLSGLFGSLLGDASIFPAWRSMRALEKFFKEHPIKTLPPGIEKWIDERTTKPVKRPALITGLSLFFYAVGIILFGGGIVMMIFGLIEPYLGELVLAGIFFATMGGLSLLSARYMWRLMKEGAEIAVGLCAMSIFLNAYFTLESPWRWPIAIWFIIIPSIIILLIKHEWKKFIPPPALVKRNLSRKA